MAPIYQFLLTFWMVFATFGPQAFSEGIYKNGDIVLGGLLTVRHKNSDDSCGVLKPQGLAYVEAMLYAVETINKDASLLPNITIGYDIENSCDSPALANNIAFEFVTRNQALELSYPSNKTCETRRHSGSEIRKPIATVIGPGDSSSAVVVASMLQIGSIPQISPFATSEELSLPYFKTFFRPVPPDGQQAKALADIIDYFKWGYVTVVGVDTSYGRYGVMSLEDEAQERGTFCISEIAYFPPSGYQQKIARIVSKIKRSENVKAIVLWCGPTTSIHFIQEALAQGVYGRTWLAPEGWSEAIPLFKNKYMPVIGGFVGTKLRNYNLTGFKTHLESLSYETPRVRNHTWWREFWMLEKKCPSEKICDFGSFRISEKLYSEMYTAYLSYVIDAVYTAAHAIDAAFRCPSYNRNCLSTIPFLKPKEVLRFLPNVTFRGITGSVEFNSNGDSIRSAAYDIVNLQPGNDGPQIKIVGNWDRGSGTRLKINDTVMYWNNGSRLVPVSVCSEPCKPGFMQTRTIACCWKCISCHMGSISMKFSSPNCTKCPLEKMPDEHQRKCVDLPEINITLYDSQAIVILVAAGLGFVAVTFVLVVGIKYRNTPVVKSSNREMSLLFLIGILIGFAASALELTRPSKLICLVLNPMHAFYYTLCLSILFVKTSRLVNVFKLNSLSSKFGRSGMLHQFLVLLLLNAIVAVILAIWHGFDPPFLDVTIEPLRWKLLGCRDHANTIGIALQGLLYTYQLALSVLVAYYAFKARKLPANFSEARYIAFAMYMQLICTMCYATLQNSIEGIVLVTFSSAIIILSAYGFLICMFAPKVYVILKYPERNTPEFVKVMVANHSMKSNFSRVTIGAKASAATKPTRQRSEAVLSSLSSESVVDREELRKNSSRQRKTTVSFSDDIVEETHPSVNGTNLRQTSNGFVRKEGGEVEESKRNGKLGPQERDMKLVTLEIIPDKPKGVITGEAFEGHVFFESRI